MSKKKQKAHKAGKPEKNQIHHPPAKPGKTTVTWPSFPDMVRQHPVPVAFGLVLILLLVADFTVHKHESISLGNVPEFYAVYGFLSAAALVFAARILRVLPGQNGSKKR